MTEFFVFAYDVVSDRRRARIARLLEDEGIRVQKSVFEVRVSPARARSLAERIDRHLDPGDSLRVYPLSPVAVGSVIVVGSGLPPEQGDFLLV